MSRIPKEDQDQAWYWESPERDECESKGMYWVPGYFKENGERVSGYCRKPPHEGYSPTKRTTKTGKIAVIKPERRGKMKGKYLVNVYNENGTHFSRTRYPDRESAIREKKRIEEEGY